jgi:c-di-GMP-binding flagellar brake protein YcgR
VDGIREPDAEQEVYRFASSLSKIASPAVPSRRSGVASAPGHSTGRAEERRAYVRVRLGLSLRVQRVAGQRDTNARALRTEDISSSGVYFLSPHSIEPGTPIELELLVVDRPLGSGSVRMRAEAHVVRAAGTPRPGWYGVAASFDDIRFFRDEQVPPRFHAG